MPTPTSTPEWRERHPELAQALVCDGLLPWSRQFLPEGADLIDTLTRFRANGIDHVSLTAAAGADDAITAFARLGFFVRELRSAGWIRVVTSAREVRAAKADGCFSVSFHFQTCTPFAADLDLVDAFRHAGIVRSIVAYNEANVFGDGCHESRNAGLSALGRRLLARMDAAGMLVDLSHTGERTTLDAMAEPLARPPVFSHSNARALFDHERNLTDTQIRACGARQGYIGVNGVGMFLGVTQADIPRSMSEHVAYIAELIGADRVGLGLDFMYLEGSDFNFFTSARDCWPRGYPDPPWPFLQPEQMGHLVDQLAARGFSNAELRGILGDNYLNACA
jgi:membrane dipeptidase